MAFLTRSGRLVVQAQGTARMVQARYTGRGLVDTLELTPSFCRCRMSSQEATSALVGSNSKRKELVVNSKWEVRSADPVYSHLIYSSEVDVMLTAKRGKAWMESKAKEEFRAENDRKFRLRAADVEPPPVVLGYLGGGALRVQGEGDVRADREILVQGDLQLGEGARRVEGGEGAGERTQLPYTVYTDIEKLRLADISQETGAETVKPESRRGRRGKSRNSPETVSETGAGESEQAFEVIPDSLNTDGVRQLFSEDHLYKHGTADPDIAGTRSPCGGCGAHLHCRDENLPGFTPSQLLQDLTREELRAQLCQRCYIIREYNVALKVNVAPEDYPKAIEHIKDEEALVLLVVDLLDFPGSVWPGILQLLGAKKKVIVVGNKLDLIVPDSRIYQKRITNIIRREFMRKMDQEGPGSSFPQVVGSCCVSATTGLNVETLVQIIFDTWRTSNNFMPGDIYIVGCTNVGKSSLFNSLLDSDLCKVLAHWCLVTINLI